MVKFSIPAVRQLNIYFAYFKTNRNLEFDHIRLIDFYFFILFYIQRFLFRREME